jgi:hypothetical protein
MQRIYHYLALAAALVLALVASALAGRPEITAEPVGSQAASDEELTAQRGGFTSMDGLLVSFGIDRAVYVNGILDTASSFTVTSPGAGQPLVATAISGNSGLKVVQIGPAGSNIFNQGKVQTAAMPGVFTVIQNSLNGQVITNSTTLNAQIANVGLFRNMNLSAAIRQQLINGLR